VKYVPYVLIELWSGIAPARVGDTAASLPPRDGTNADDWRCRDMCMLRYFSLPKSRLHSEQVKVLDVVDDVITSTPSVEVGS